MRRRDALHQLRGEAFVPFCQRLALLVGQPEGRVSARAAVTATLRPDSGQQARTPHSRTPPYAHIHAHIHTYSSTYTHIYACYGNAGVGNTQTNLHIDTRMLYEPPSRHIRHCCAGTLSAAIVPPAVLHAAQQYDRLVEGTAMILPTAGSTRAATRTPSPSHLDSHPHPLVWP